MLRSLVSPPLAFSDEWAKAHSSFGCRRRIIAQRVPLCALRSADLRRIAHEGRSDPLAGTSTAAMPSQRWARRFEPSADHGGSVSGRPREPEGSSGGRARRRRWASSHRILILAPHPRSQVVIEDANQPSDTASAEPSRGYLVTDSPFADADPLAASGTVNQRGSRVTLIAKKRIGR